MGNQQESDLELSRMKPKKDVQPVPGPKAVTTVGGDGTSPAGDPHKIGGSDFSTGFQQALEASLSRPVARLEAQTDLGRLRLRKEFRGAGKADWRVRFKRQGFRRAL